MAGGLDREERTPTESAAASGAGGPEAIDDLWHAAVNSRGKYFNANNAQQVLQLVSQTLLF